MPLRLPILLGNCNELIVKLGIDLRSELLGHPSWHDLTSPVRVLSYFFTLISKDNSLYIHVIVNKILISGAWGFHHMPRSEIEKVSLGSSAVPFFTAKSWCIVGLFLAAVDALKSIIFPRKLNLVLLLSGRGLEMN